MDIDIITLFPGMFDAIADYGVTSRAIERELLTLRCWNPREYTEDRHRTVDDRPYGGGPGMVMKTEPLQRALEDVQQWLSSFNKNCHTFHQNKQPIERILGSASVQELSRLQQIIEQQDVKSALFPDK